MAATWMVDGFGLKAVNWVRQIVWHNGAAIDIWSQDHKKLTRLISLNGRPKGTMPVDTAPSSTSPPAKTRSLRARSSYRPIEQLTERSFKNLLKIGRRKWIIVKLTSTHFPR